MGRRSINTTKSGKYMNPTDQYRKEARKRELKKNKKQRIMVRTAVLKGKDPLKLLEEMALIDRMEYNPMQTPSLNEKVLREKRKKLRETFDRVFKLYEKERPEYAVELKKANNEYEKTRTQLQLFYDQVRNAERVQLDQIPLPDAPDIEIPGTIPLPADIPLHMLTVPLMTSHLQPHSILKKVSAYGLPPMLHLIGPQMQAPVLTARKGPAGPPPGPPPVLSDSEDEEEEEYDPEKGINLGQVDLDDDDDDDEDDDDQLHTKTRRIRFADDFDEEDDISIKDQSSSSDEGDSPIRKERKKEKKRKKKETETGKKKISALQARMLKMAGQDTPDFEKDDESGSSSSSSSVSSSSSSSSEDDDYEFDEDNESKRSNTKHRNRQEEIDRIRPPARDVARQRIAATKPGFDHEEGNPDMTEEEAAAITAARLIEEAEQEAENLQLSLTRLHPPGPPPGLPPNLAHGPAGMQPGASPMFLRLPPPRGPPLRLMPPGPPAGRPQGLPPGPPPGLPPHLRAPPIRIPTPVGVPPPPLRMIRMPGMVNPSMPPPQSIAPVGNPGILSAPPNILRPRGPEEVAAVVGLPSRVTIQAKPQIKNKIGDITRFMPTSLKVRREMRDQKGKLKFSGKEEEHRMYGAQARPQPAPAAAQAKTKDDAYDQFMREMEGLI